MSLLLTSVFRWLEEYWTRTTQGKTCGKWLMGFQIGNLLTLCKNPDPAFKPRLGCCVFVWDTCLDLPFVHRKGDEIVRWTENKSSGDSLLWTKSDNIPGRVKPRKEEQPPPSPVLFFTADVVWQRHITLTMLSSPKSISYWCNVREAWQIAGREGGVDLWLTSVPLRGVLLSPSILWTARASRNITQGIKLSIEQLHTFPSL